MIFRAQSMMVSVRSPQEVELHQARRFDVILVELGDDIAAGIVAVQRCEVGQYRRRDHDTAGMHAGVAGQPLQGARQVDEVLDLLLGVIQALELRLLRQGIVEGDPSSKGMSFAILST